MKLHALDVHFNYFHLICSAINEKLQDWKTIQGKYLRAKLQIQWNLCNPTPEFSDIL
jgi:hypothetical protein